MAYRRIVEWLLSISALEERDGGKFATAYGQAQQFIYDNLETILAKRFGQ